MKVELNTRKYNTRRADYLLRNKNNERSETIDIRGIVQDQDAVKAFKELNTRASKDKQKKFFMAASLSPQPGYDDKMTREDWIRSADIAEQILNLAGQPRIMVMHQKIGQDGITRTHCHVDWFREKNGKLISDSLYKYKAQPIEREIETALGHPLTARANRTRYEDARGRVAKDVLDAAQRQIAADSFADNKRAKEQEAIERMSRKRERRREQGYER